VGDLAVYKGTFEGSGGGSIEFEQTLFLKELTEQNAVVQSTLIVDEQERTQEINVKVEDLISSDMIEYVMTECQNEGGQLEAVTVEAGQIETCVLTNEPKVKTWLGRVPFGVVKQKMLDEDENIITLELKDYVFGK